MLPLQQAYEVKHSIIEYLKATFRFKEKAVQQAFDEFTIHPTNGVFKGPYVSLKLPFVKAHDDEEVPLDIKPRFPPYDHQIKSFRRLHTKNDHVPQATLITTGTSSGKTECFLYPILDYCYKNQDRPGIKVIILYPMNALATDQAKRLAEAIWNDDRIKGKITAGLFIGEGKSKQVFSKDMAEDHIVENQQSIVDSPPDILLTNFKMLDYALMRGKYHNLWSYNFQDEQLLKFLVLDELHTYDGAQGTDVANLIRRLKLKLQISEKQLCAIGTSATIGNSENAKVLLTEYASKVFGEAFEPDSIITENRLKPEEFFIEDSEGGFMPRTAGLIESRLKEDENYEDYIKRQKVLWQLPLASSKVDLGNELIKLGLTKDLVTLCSTQILALNDLIRELAKINKEFEKLPEWDNEKELNPREEILNSLLALIAEARTGEDGRFPFLFVQIQLWVREFSGFLREINEVPTFTWKDKIGKPDEPKALPSYFCRECGASGWLGVKDDNKNLFYEDPNQVYEYFFSNHKNVYLINTPKNKHIDEYEPKTEINEYLDKQFLHLFDTGDSQSMKIHAVRKLDEKSYSRHICPECNTENTISIIGTRIATLSSITVSQVLSSNLDERTDKYRKILAFTNSVQDAAHQAGFIESRNYRFTFRSSLQKVINLFPDGIALDKLQEEFISYWKKNADENGRDDGIAYYYRFFPSDYKARVDIDRDYREGKDFTLAFKKEFDLRMKWEIASEFGFNATIGRTLEKSQASAIKFDDSKLKLTFTAMQSWMDTNNLTMITEADFLTFLNGILHRVRIKGGLDHDFLKKFRNDGLKLWDLNWMKDHHHFLNKYFGPRSRLPKLITTQPHNRGLLDTTFTNANNWFRSYFTKSFPLASNYNALVNDFYEQLFESMVKVGLVNKNNEGSEQNYAITPDSIIVGKGAKRLECDNCGSFITVSNTSHHLDGLKCLNYTCKGGIYLTVNSRKKNYYELVYNRSRAPRIYAAEHTGILERKVREQKEYDFKERPNHNSLNTVVATSTLEMGIDIGSLNATMNNCVPPLPSNFLQRIGRAGRSSGSALILNFAQSKAHDLFYYEEPKDMMEGEVYPPGCFLEAKGILFRHFLAYCIDFWTTEDPINHYIPGTLRTLKLLTADLSDQTFFANKIIGFIKAHEDHLLQSFQEMYQKDITDFGVFDTLRKLLQTENYYDRIRDVFLKLKAEYQAIYDKRKEIDELIKTKKLSESDEYRQLLEAEKRSLWGIKRMIDKRSVLEHLTNKGLLPNYAFPETGVTLNARVNSFKAKGSENIPTEKQFEIVRSANVAIKEFAPDNNFYSQGFKFDISGINTFDWKDAGTLKKMRFCSNCDHLENAVGVAEKTCPKCGDASWASSKNVHTFVKLNAVKSNNTREKSTLDDSRDDRLNAHYNVSTHVNFGESVFQGAWGMREIPFGIEFVKNIKIILNNLGLSNSVDSNKIVINQYQNIPAHGFVTCKYCGKSTSSPHLRNDKSDKFHYGYCKNRDEIYTGKSDSIFEEIFLFKEIDTEVLKILLPIQEIESLEQLNMFRAGFELGLKKYYGGNPQHLAMMDYSEYNSKNGKFDKYLLVYDTIPGGTGYLEKLFNPTEFTEVLLLAYKSIKECKCQHHGKDGCYRCIFTYGNQYNQSQLSRKEAERFFKKIVDKSNAWERYSDGLGSLAGNGQIEESELEYRLIRSLRNYAKINAHNGINFEKFIDEGEVQYHLKIEKLGYTYLYHIKAQKNLGVAEGVRFNTRADFYIQLLTAKFQGKEIRDPKVLGSIKNIAVYLDGYTYHASSENMRFYTDLSKRQAIIDSGDKISWTLTWADMELFDEALNNGGESGDILACQLPEFRKMSKPLQKLPTYKANISSLLESKNSLERLLWYLNNPLDTTLNKKVGLFLMHFQAEFGKHSFDCELLESFLLEREFRSERATKTKEGNFYITPKLDLSESTFYEFRIAVKVNDLELKSAILMADKKLHVLPKDDWETFWRVYNILQFSDQVEFSDEPDVEPFNKLYDTEVIDTKEWLEYHDPLVHHIVLQLLKHNVAFEKDGGYIFSDGNLFAEAMLGFEKQKIFIEALSEDDKNIFLKAGYREILINEFDIKLVLS
jgi:DEAD/DEAH box helicase domain-containing protein